MSEPDIKSDQRNSKERRGDEVGKSKKLISQACPSESHLAP